MSALAKLSTYVCVLLFVVIFMSNGNTTFAVLSAVLSVILTVIVLVWKTETRLSPHGKAVLITGCDTGFGHATARRLHDVGLTVFAGCLLKDSGGDGAVELQKISSDRLHVLQLDVTDEEQIRSAVDFVKEKVGEHGLWALVNNAGRSTFGHVEWCTMQTYQDMADVTLWGVVRTTKAFLPLIRKAKGRVVNVTSILGLINSPSRSAYTICKHGVESFSDCLRYEMKPWGVTVCVVEPANFIVATGIYTPESVRKIGDKLWNEATDEIRKDYGKDSFEAQVDIMSKYSIEGYRGMDWVVDAIEAAVMSEKPQQRYFVCDWKVKLKTMARVHLPSCIGENM